MTDVATIVNTGPQPLTFQLKVSNEIVYDAPLITLGTGEQLDIPSDTFFKLEDELLKLEKLGFISIIAYPELKKVSDIAENKGLIPSMRVRL